jgi:hypothetical protein
MRTSLLATAAVVALAAGGAAHAGPVAFPTSSAVAGSFSGAGSSSGAGSHGTGSAASGSAAGNVSWGTSHVTAGNDSGNTLGTHNTVDTSSGSVGGTLSFGHSAGSAGGGGHGSQGGVGFGNGVSYIPNQQAAPSDRRLKHDVETIGQLANGLRLYSYSYLGSDERFAGVMAQELLLDPRFASAVQQDEDGLMRVDYAAIGLRPSDFAAMAAAGEAAMSRYRDTLH